MRQPTFVERLLFRIPCVGFCAGDAPKDRAMCASACGAHLPYPALVAARRAKELNARSSGEKKGE